MIPQPRTPGHDTTPTLAAPAPVAVPADWSGLLLADPDAPVRFQYTRADAIYDRALIEVPRRLASVFGLTVPTAITATVWAEVIAWPDTAAATEGPWPFECEAARLAEVLHHLPPMHAEGESASFQVFRVHPATPQARPQPVDLIVTVEPGDCLETVATIAHARETSR